MMGNLLSPAHLFFWSFSNSTGILLFKITEKGVMPPSHSMDNLVKRVSLALMMNKLKKVNTQMTLYCLLTFAAIFLHLVASSSTI
jgi:hypothetical protein